MEVLAKAKALLIAAKRNEELNPHPKPEMLSAISDEAWRELRRRESESRDMILYMIENIENENRLENGQ